jgi:hypothetical protein
LDTYSIAGKWHGHYEYDMMPNHGANFTICFSEIAGCLEGTVLDDNSAGEATLAGSFSFPYVRFEKVYLKASEAKQVSEEKKLVPIKVFGIELPIGRPTVTTTTIREIFGNPIKYEGSMSDDGKTLNGIWTVTSESGAASTGNWSATRLIKEEKEI